MTKMQASSAPFFNSFSLSTFLLLTFGLSFLTEGIFLFFRQSFTNQSFYSGYLVLFFALIFLYSLIFCQIQAGDCRLQNNSLKAALASNINWLILSPLFFFRFYQLLLIWRPLPAKVLSFLFFYRWKILPIAGALYLIILFVLYRSLMLPKYLNQGHSLKQSFRSSWQASKKSWIRHLCAFFFLPLTFFVCEIILKISCIWFSQYISHKYAAITLLVVYRLIQNVVSTIFFLYLTSLNNQLSVNQKKKKVPFLWLIIPILAYLGLNVSHYNLELRTNRQEDILTISHRGVSNANGLQNSITALAKTSQKYHPDLIEMDIQETADHQLIVMHDENLKELAGKNLQIDNTSWEELKRLTLTENDYHDKIALFSDYLKEANQLNQQLLIELKVTTKTKATIVRQLAPLKKQLASHQLQSMDLDVANELKQQFPTHQVGYILPFDLLGSPKSDLDFVNIEARTAKQDLIQRLRSQNQAVYIWSANSPQQAAIFQAQPVKGILSDDLRVFTSNRNPLAAKTASIIQFD